MITGTNADCKIIKTEIQESTALITCLIFATATTSPAKAFQFYIKDEGSSSYELASSNIYWVDKINSYNSNVNNVDTKKYKEVILSVDITKGNEASIVDNHWVRKCYIQLVNTANTIKTAAWSSDLLTLVSTEFDVPEIKDIFIYAKKDYTAKKYNLVIDFNLSISSQADFNYTNKNFKAVIDIKSISTESLIEEIELNSTSTSNICTTSNYYELGVPVSVEIKIIDTQYKIYKKSSRIVVPYTKTRQTYLKTDDGIRKVLCWYIVDSIDSEDVIA